MGYFTNHIATYLEENKVRRTASPYVKINSLCAKDLNEKKYKNMRSKKWKFKKK